MSEIKEEVKEPKEVKEQMSEVKEESKEAMPEAKEAKEDKLVQFENTLSMNDGLFITEDDTFDINIKWYKNNDVLFTDESDEGFDDNHDPINEFTVTFKYPSQGDYELIINSVVYKSPDEMSIADVLQMELVRLVTLVRGWSLDDDLKRMIELDPFMVKAILKKIRDKIGMKGIL